MKYPTLLLLTLTLAFTFASNSAIAQEADPQPGMVVFHQNIVDLSDVPKLNAISDSLFKPILNELVDEGKLMGWGQLMHNWGDEWNFNYYFSVENHRAFLDFWSEYTGRLNERHPGWFGRIAHLFRAHKDTMYSIRTMR